MPRSVVTRPQFDDSFRCCSAPNTKISGEPPFWPWLVRCILLLGCVVRHSMLHIQQLLVVPHILMPRSKLHAPSCRKSKVRNYFWTPLQHVQDVHRVEELRVFGQRVTPTRGTTHTRPLRLGGGVH
jgi:hypothetical protein